MIVLDLNVGDSVLIGESTVTLKEKSGRRAKVAIDAPRELRVERRQGIDTRIMNVEEIEAGNATATTNRATEYVRPDFPVRTLPIKVA